MTITIMISLVSGLLGTLFVEFFINPKRERRKNQKVNVYKAYEIISENSADIRRLHDFFIEMIKTECHDGKINPITNYFNFTNNLISLDKAKLYIVAVDNKDCSESFERLSNYVNNIQKYARDCFKNIDAKEYEDAQRYCKKIADTLAVGGEFDKEFNELCKFLKNILQKKIIFVG